MRKGKLAAVTKMPRIGFPSFLYAALSCRLVSSEPIIAGRGGGTASRVIDGTHRSQVVSSENEIGYAYARISKRRWKVAITFLCGLELI